MTKTTFLARYGKMPGHNSDVMNDHIAAAIISRREDLTPEHVDHIMKNKLYSAQIELLSGRPDLLTPEHIDQAVHDDHTRSHALAVTSNPKHLDDAIDASVKKWVPSEFNMHSRGIIQTGIRRHVALGTIKPEHMQKVESLNDVNLSANCRALIEYGRKK
jgi:hypothetical protein